MTNRSDVRKFQKIINTNYEHVISYYRQREINLFQARMSQHAKDLFSKGGLTPKEAVEFEKGIVQGIFNDLNEEFNKKSSDILEGRTLNSKNQNFITTDKKFDSLSLSDLQLLAQHYQIPVQSLTTIFKPSQNGNYSTEEGVHSILGQLKEEIINPTLSYFSGLARDIFENSIMKDLENFLVSDAQQLGKTTITQNSASRDSGNSVGIDYGSTFLANNPNHTEIPITLYARLNYGQRNIFSQQKTQQQRMENFLDQYLKNPSLISSWGLQIKKQNDQKTIPYRNYAKLQSDINFNYETGVPPHVGNKPFTWNATYAYYYMLANISDNLIAALGPTTAGVLLGNKFYFMSDFVSGHIFRYALQGMKTTNSSRTEIVSSANDPLDVEIFPNIKNEKLQADKDTAFRSQSLHGVARAYIRGGTKKDKGDVRYQLEIKQF